MRLVNITKDIVLAEKVKPAVTPVSRFLGLMGSKLGPGEGMLLRPCAAVHTFFVPVSLDVLFLSRHGSVLGLRPDLEPWRVAACRGAYQTVELPAGTIRRTGTEIGDQMRLEEG